MHYEECGLFLGLISYPFSVDGKYLYNNELKKIFTRHKKNLSKYSCASDSIDEMLYCPVAYRMLGTPGLAILSLVDDYEFCSRTFSPNHIGLSKNENGVKNKFQSVVITGISEANNLTDSLEEKAKNTFLREKEKYPFIGIIRLKIDYRLLKGRGCEIVRTIRQWFTSGYKDTVIHRYVSIHNTALDFLLLDCFDNDELVIVAFSNKIGVLYEFLDLIRRLNCKDLGVPYNKKNVEKHIFASCHLNFGYHTEYNITKKTNNKKFLSIPKKSNISNKTRNKIQDDDYNKLKISCICETKPGHRIYFCEYIKKTFKVRSFRRTVTGGTVVYFDLPLAKIHRVEELCREKTEGFQRHLRRIKIILNDPRKLKFNRQMPEGGEDLFKANSIIKEKEIQKVERYVKQIGISKIVCEKLLSLFRLYNDCCHNHLQYLYFEEFKQLVGFLSPHDADSVYTRITSAERVSSMRTHLNLNINHIIYPELFATTAWKEAANFSLAILKRLNTTHENKFVQLFNIWNSFVDAPSSYRLLQYELYQRVEFQSDDPVFRILKMWLNDNRLLKYFISDYIVYHMAFQRNFKMMWHFYLKTMLQTTNCYHRLGRIRRDHVICILLRLWMVALREKGSSRWQGVKKFIENHSNKPYDYLLAEIWNDSFSKIKQASEILFNILDIYGFTEISETLALISEARLIIKPSSSKSSTKNKIMNSSLHQKVDNLNDSNTKKQVEFLLKNRKTLISQMKKLFSQYKLLVPDELLVDKKLIGPDIIICMLYAYLQNIYKLDRMAGKMEPMLKSVPRDFAGNIDYNILGDSKRCPTAIHILADPTSGFIIPSQTTRKKYFALRTTLYRSLWHYRMMESQLNLI